MEENDYLHEMNTLSEYDLRYYLSNKEHFEEEAVLAARLELEKRGFIEPPQIEKVQDLQITDISGFPVKPVEEINQQSIYKSLISLGLFIGAFYLVFKWEFKYILVITGVIIIHELGHYIAMRLFKYKDLSIFFMPLIGAFASGSKDKISQKQSVIILLSGPVPGIIIGLFLYYFGLRDGNDFLIRISNIFILINLFNLMPIIPLDGGRLVKSLFFENNEIINRIFIYLSIAVLTYYSLKTESYFLLAIPFFLLLQLNSQSQIKKVKEGVLKKGINLDQSFAELTNEDYWLIRDEIGTHMKYYSNIISPKEYIASVNEQKIIRQIKSIIMKKPEKDLKIGPKILITFFWMLTFVIPSVVIAIYYIKLGIHM